MMPQSSFTSSSDAEDPTAERTAERRWRVYLVGFLVSSLGLVAGAWAVIESQRTESAPLIPFEILYAHQVEKLRGSPPHTVFLGDSSLGNAISVAAWEEVAGTSALNLALTGTYGYAGTYNFLRRVVKRGHPKNVVIMHTADMLTRPVSTRGFELTKPEPTLMERASKYWKETMNFAQLTAALKRLRESNSDNTDKKKRGRRRSRELIHDDYIKQRAPLKETKQRQRMDPKRIRRGKLKYLELTAELCRHERLNCIYVHGPLADATCQASRDYLALASDLILTTGIALPDRSPVCLPRKQVGDEVDHVHPKHKRRWTRRYYERLKPLLK